MKIYTFLLALIMAFTLGSYELKAQEGSSEIQMITSVITDYIEGSTKGQPDRLKKVFHEDLNLYYLRKNTLQTWTGEAYIADTKEGKATGESGEIISIDFENDIATAKVQILYPGAKTAYIDYFMLAKIEGQWTILHKMFTVKNLVQ